MFAVFRRDSDGCTYTYDTLLFVTQTEDSARDLVTLAELEFDEALKIERPEWSLSALRENRDRVVVLRKAYEQKINAMFTVDTTSEGHELISYGSGDKPYYFYHAVEVR